MGLNIHKNKMISENEKKLDSQWVKINRNPILKAKAIDMCKVIRNLL